MNLREEQRDAEIASLRARVKKKNARRGDDRPTERGPGPWVIQIGRRRNRSLTA